MLIETLVEQMTGNTRHGGGKATCPACGKTAEVEWTGGNWARKIVVRCLGDEAGWQRWENACGLEVQLGDDKEAELARMRMLLPSTRPKGDPKERRIGRSTFWPFADELDND